MSRPLPTSHSQIHHFRLYKMQTFKMQVKKVVEKKRCDSSIYILSLLEPEITLLNSKKATPLPSEPFLSQINSVHTAITYFVKIHYSFTASSLLPLISRNFFLSSDFLNKVQGSQELKSCHTQNY